MRIRRLRKAPAGLDVTAFINLIVVLVPFLLSTAVFSTLSILELSLPAQSSGALEKLDSNNLQLEVVVRADAIEVGDRIGGLIQRIERSPTATGGGAGAKAEDIKALSALMAQIKQRFPDKTEAAVLPEPQIAYDVLVQVMDAVRAGRQVQGARVVTVDLFPDISIGDAPIRTAAGGPAR
jgi:biopolymer transport protein ExbD